MPPSNADRNWGGAGRSQPDNTLINNPGASNGEAPLSVGTRTHNAFNNPDAMMKYMKDDKFLPYFGYANGIVPSSVPGYKQSKEEVYDLPEAYKGANPYMSKIIIASVLEAECWGTSIACPWKKWDGMKIQWDEWIFDRALPTRTPEEAVSRLLSSSFNEHSATTERFGIAFIMEHGFWGTEKGKIHYAMQMVQIRNAIAFGAQFGVTMALLYPDAYIDEQRRFSVGTKRNKNDVQNFFQRELDDFAILQKDTDGWATMITRGDDIMINRTQEKSDFIIVPLGAKRLLNSRPENSFFFLNGGIQKDGFDREKLSAGDGRMVVESIKHKMGYQVPSTDPCYQVVTIGTKFHMVDHHLDMVDLQDFKISMLDQFIFDEDRDDWYKMSFSYAVRTMGLYTGWETAQKVGDMPITTELGRKFFKEVATWGQVLFSADRLEKFIKQLQGKPDEVYEDFIRHFVINGDDAPVSMGMSIDEAEEKKQEAKYAEDKTLVADDEQEDEERKGYANDISTALLNLQLQEDNAHRSRLEVMLNWLKSLDSEAKKQYGIKSNIASQVSEYITKNQKNLRGLHEEAKAFATYNLAWKLAQDLLIKYGLEVAARENRNGSTPFENYVLTKSKYKNYGGLSEQDERKLQELNQAGPYWKPVGDAFKAEVALIAPECGAGDKNSSTKRLAYLTDAFTLSSSFLCLFSVPQSSVTKMLQAPNSPDKPLFDLAIEFPHTAPNQNELIDRAGLFQFNIVLSAMYSIVSGSRKSGADEDAHYNKLAEAWIKLATPVNMLSKSEESFAATIERARSLHTLDYQAPMDQLIAALRNALVDMYTAKGGAPSAKSVIQAIKKVELLCAYVQSNNHACAAGARDIAEDGQSGLGPDAGGALQSLDEPLMDAIYGHSRHMHAFTASRRSTESSKEDIAKRLAKLNVASKKLAEMTKALREKHPLAKGRKDASGHWKPTYIKLMLEMDKASFERYFQTNEFCLNNIDSKGFGIEKIDKEEIESDKTFAVLAQLAGATDDASAVRAVKEKFIEGMENSKEPKAETFGIELALEWTRMWSTGTSTMENWAKASGPGEQKGLGLAFVALMLKKYNFQLLQGAVKDAWPAIAKAGKPNEKYSQLFINTEDKKLAHRSADIKIIEGVDEYGVSEPGKKKRLSTDALRNVLMEQISILDGFFWLWSINNDMIQALGNMGFKLACRYEAGTAIMLSAWGKTGNTFYGHADMMLSDNAATKMHYGHLTYNSKTVVMNSQRILHLRHCLSKNYEGGNGHMVWDATNPQDRAEYRNGELTKDIHFVPVLMNQNVDANHIDATGRYHDDIGANEDAQKMTHYDAAPIYAEFWGWSHEALNLRDGSYSNVRVAHENTIMFQEHQSMYNSGSGAFDLYVRGKGHWGDRVYPGCGRVRRGLESWLKPVKYDNTSTIAITV